MSLISIITVNYNNKSGLEQTLKSVEEQRATSYEHIVIDGASIDGSQDLIQSYQAHLACTVSEPDTGVYQAMNKGIEKAKGEYLLFLNSGDHFHSKTSLEIALEHLKSGEDIIYFDLEVIENGNPFVKTYPDTLSFSYFVEDTLPHPASFIKRDAFAKAATYREDFKILSDWKFFIDAICKYQMTYKKVPQVLSTFYIGGMSSDPKNRDIKYAERLQVLEQEYAPYFQDIQDTIAYRDIIETFRNSRIISLLVKYGFLNKF